MAESSTESAWPDRITLSGISATGYHGVLPHERRDGQPFSADVTLHVDTRPAAGQDRLDLTVDYGALAEGVAAVLAGDPADLIETVAERIAALALSDDRVGAVHVVVHKPQAPVSVPVADVSVAIHRDRSRVPAIPPRASIPMAAFPEPGFPERPAYPEPEPEPAAAMPAFPGLPPFPEPPAAAMPAFPGLPPFPEPPAFPEPEPVSAAPAFPEPRAFPEPEPVSAAPAFPEPRAFPEPPAFPESESEPMPTFPVGAPTPALPVWEPVSSASAPVPVAEPLSPVPVAEPASAIPAPESPAADSAPNSEPFAPTVLEEVAPVRAESFDGPRDRLDLAPDGEADVVLALGSNVGASQETLRQAVEDLAATEGLEITAVGPLARTAPVGGPDQQDFLNTVVLARTRLSPRALLHACQEVENRHGRLREQHRGPRTLDVDLITYGTVVAVADDLELPHPLANQRAFVLQPWSHLDPDAVLPGLGGGPVAALGQTAPDVAGIRWMALDWWGAEERS